MPCRPKRYRRKTAKCGICRRTIRRRRSKSTGRISLRSGVRKHYWTRHRRTMMKRRR